MSAFDLSVVIPTLNEAENLPRLLGELAAQSDLSLDVVVADGGSSDDSGAIALAAGARVVPCGRGRGRQMNAGAAAARADDLLFLHADSSLRDPKLLAAALATLRCARTRRDSDRIAGHFSLRFLRQDDTPSFAYRYFEEKTRLNRTNTTNGDQGCMLSRRFFDALGGFSEDLPFLEDQKLAAKIREAGHWITLPGQIYTSARRFEEEGFSRRMILSAITMGLHSSTFPEFFSEAPELYRSQSHTARLSLAPFFQFIRDTLRTKPRRERWQRWLGAGRYVRQNTWQLWFAGDVALRAWLPNDRDVLLRCYDRVIDPVLRLYPFDVLGAAITWTWFHLSWAYFTIAERRSEPT